MVAFQRAIGDRRRRARARRPSHARRHVHRVARRDRAAHDAARRSRGATSISPMRSGSTRAGASSRTDGSRPFAGKGISVPTFEEVLRDVPDVHINVDIKGDGRRSKPMLELVRRIDAEERVTIASFHTATDGRGAPRAATPARPRSRRARSRRCSRCPRVLWRQLPFTGTAAQVPTHQGPLRFDRATFIAKCHNLGLRVDFWTIDDRDRSRAPARARRRRHHDERSGGAEAPVLVAARIAY